jgi:flagellar basal-body rod modification protein FlgD
VTEVTGVFGRPPEMSSSSSPGLGGLDGEAFLKLMVAQLRYQNPFEPMDSSQMLQQTAALTTVETLQTVAGNQAVLMGLQQASVATSLLGMEVKAINAGGEEVSGTVSGVSFTADGPLLRVDGQDIPVGNVIKVMESGSDGTAPASSQG